MRILFLLFLSLISSQAIIGQSRSSLPYKTRVLKESRSSRPIKGQLHDVKESSIIIAPFSFYRNEDETKLQKILAQDIKSITIRDRGSPGRGIIAGGFLGLLLGLGTAELVGEDCNSRSFCSLSRAVERIGYGALGLITGGIVGGLLDGTPKLKIRINGNTKLYRSQIEKLKTYQYDPLRF